MQGSKEAFGKLYDSYAPTLLGIIKRIVKKDDLAESLLQNVFIEIWNRKQGFKASNEQFFNWIFKITRSMACEELSILSKNHVNKIQKDLSSVNEKDSAQNHTASQENYKGNKAFDMENDQQAALDLVYYSGYTFDEAATELDIPITMLTKKIKMAINQLKASNRG